MSQFDFLQGRIRQIEFQLGNYSRIIDNFQHKFQASDIENKTQTTYLASLRRIIDENSKKIIAIKNQLDGLGNLDELGEKIESIEDALKDIKGSGITDIIDRLKAIEESISTDKDDKFDYSNKDNINTRLNNLEEKIDSNNGETAKCCEQLKEKVTSLTNRVDDHESKIAANTNRIDSLGGQVNQNTFDISSINGKIGSWKGPGTESTGEYPSDGKTITRKIKELDEAINGDGTDKGIIGKIGKLEEMIEEIEQCDCEKDLGGRVEKLENQVGNWDTTSGSFPGKDETITEVVQDLHEKMYGKNGEGGLVNEDGTMKCCDELEKRVEANERNIGDWNKPDNYPGGYVTKKITGENGVEEEKEEWEEGPNITEQIEKIDKKIIGFWGEEDDNGIQYPTPEGSDYGPKSIPTITEKMKELEDNNNAEIKRIDDTYLSKYDDNHDNTKNIKGNETSGYRTNAYISWVENGTLQITGHPHESGTGTDDMISKEFDTNSSVNLNPEKITISNESTGFTELTSDMMKIQNMETDPSTSITANLSTTVENRGSIPCVEIAGGNVNTGGKTNLTSEFMSISNNDTSEERKIIIDTTQIMSTNIDNSDTDNSKVNSGFILGNSLSAVSTIHEEMGIDGEKVFLNLYDKDGISFDNPSRTIITPKIIEIHHEHPKNDSSTDKYETSIKLDINDSTNNLASIKLINSQEKTIEDNASTETFNHGIEMNVESGTGNLTNNLASIRVFNEKQGLTDSNYSDATIPVASTIIKPGIVETDNLVVPGTGIYQPQTTDSLNILSPTRLKYEVGDSGYQLGNFKDEYDDDPVEDKYGFLENNEIEEENYEEEVEEEVSDDEGGKKFEKRKVWKTRDVLKLKNPYIFRKDHETVGLLNNVFVSGNINVNGKIKADNVEIGNNEDNPIDLMYIDTIQVNFHNLEEDMTGTGEKRVSKTNPMTVTKDSIIPSLRDGSENKKLVIEGDLELATTTDEQTTVLRRHELFAKDGNFDESVKIGKIENNVSGQTPGDGTIDVGYQIVNEGNGDEYGSRLHIEKDKLVFRDFEISSGNSLGYREQIVLDNHTTKNDPKFELNKFASDGSYTSESKVPVIASTEITTDQIHIFKEADSDTQSKDYNLQTDVEISLTGMSITKSQIDPSMGKPGFELHGFELDIAKSSDSEEPKRGILDIFDHEQDSSRPNGYYRYGTKITPGTLRTNRIQTYTDGESRPINMNAQVTLTRKNSIENESNYGDDPVKNDYDFLGVYEKTENGPGTKKILNLYNPYIFRKDKDTVGLLNNVFINGDINIKGRIKNISSDSEEKKDNPVDLKYIDTVQVNFYGNDIYEKGRDVKYCGGYITIKGSNYVEPDDSSSTTNPGEMTITPGNGTLFVNGNIDNQGAESDLHTITTNYINVDKDIAVNIDGHIYLGAEADEKAKTNQYTGEINNNGFKFGSPNIDDNGGGYSVKIEKYKNDGGKLPIQNNDYCFSIDNTNNRNDDNKSNYLGAGQANGILILNENDYYVNFYRGEEEQETEDQKKNIGLEICSVTDPDKNIVDDNSQVLVTLGALKRILKSIYVKQSKDNATIPSTEEKKEPEYAGNSEDLAGYINDLYTQTSMFLTIEPPTNIDDSISIIDEDGSVVGRGEILGAIKKIRNILDRYLVTESDLAIEANDFNKNIDRMIKVIRDYDFLNGTLGESLTKSTFDAEIIKFENLDEGFSIENFAEKFTGDVTEYQRKQRLLALFGLVVFMIREYEEKYLTTDAEPTDSIEPDPAEIYTKLIKPIMEGQVSGPGVDGGEGVSLNAINNTSAIPVTSRGFIRTEEEEVDTKPVLTIPDLNTIINEEEEEFEIAPVDLHSTQFKPKRKSMWYEGSISVRIPKVSIKRAARLMYEIKIVLEINEKQYQFTPNLKSVDMIEYTLSRKIMFNHGDTPRADSDKSDVRIYLEYIGGEKDLTFANLAKIVDYDLPF